MIINDPAVINIPVTEFGKGLEELYQGGVRHFHIDIMDGHYVPNICFPQNGIRDMKEKYPDCVMDVHLMVDDPLRYVPLMKEYGADWVCFHLDATSFARRTLSEIRNAGMLAGVAVNPSQRIDLLEPLLGFFDIVLFMSVEPGFAGQKFLPGSMERLQELNELRERSGEDFLIIVDGGIHYGNLAGLVLNGANAIVTNVYTVFHQPEGITEACRKFARCAAEAEQAGKG